MRGNFVNNPIYGLLLEVVVSASQLILRLDSAKEVGLIGSDQPVIILTIDGCQQIESVSDILRSHVGESTGIAFDSNTERGSRLFCYLGDEDDEYPIACDRLSTSQGEYNLADLKLKLERLNSLYTRGSEHDDEWIRYYSSLLKGFETELRKELDKADRKLEFFAGSDKAEKYEQQKQIYQQIVDLFELWKQKAKPR